MGGKIAVFLRYFLNDPYNSGSMAADLNKSPFQYVYFSFGYCVFTSFYIKVAIFCMFLV